MSKQFQRITALLTLFLASLSQAEAPIFDMHTHYKWSQKEVTSPAQAIEFLDDNNIRYAVVIGKPPELALALKKQAPDRIVPFFSPYKESLDWFRWQHDEKVLTAATHAIASGKYKGIGELHIIGGFSMNKQKAKVLDGLMQLAQKQNVPIMLHTEFSRPDYMLWICKSHPKTRIIWAHSGAILTPAQVDSVMQQCPNVWGGLAARDPWRYVNNQHTDEQGKLLPEWKALLLKYPDRFMVGSDTVWPVDQMDRWDAPDTGWEELDRFWNFHKSWLAQLPQEVAHKLQYQNAVKFFGLEAE